MEDKLLADYLKEYMEKKLNDTIEEIEIHKIEHFTDESISVTFYYRSNNFEKDERQLFIGREKVFEIYRKNN